MRRLHPQRFIPWVFFICGLLTLALTSWPLPFESSQWTAVTINDPNLDFFFSLDWPTSMRVGETRTAVLKAAQNNRLTDGSMLEARLEFPELVIVPNGSTAQPVGSNGVQPLEYRWSITALRPGEVNGTLWIYLVAQSAEGVQQSDALVARAVGIRAFNILGIPVTNIRWISGIFIAIGIALLIRPTIIHRRKMDR